MPRLLFGEAFLFLSFTYPVAPSQTTSATPILLFDRQLLTCLFCDL